MGQKILVVEDNELNLKLFCDLLRAHGYEAEPVRDAREAVDRARAFAPDLVVMDIQMPYVSGLELIETMKADEGLRRTPIMAVTAYAAKGDEERIRDAGAEGYVSKPISVLKFVQAVAGLLEAAADKQADGASAAGEALPAEVSDGAPDDSPAALNGDDGASFGAPDDIGLPVLGATPQEGGSRTGETTGHGDAAPAEPRSDIAGEENPDSGANPP